MAEWLIEKGIGEDRALLVENDQVLAARLHWTGELLAGQFIHAKLASKPSGSRRGVALDGKGREILLDRLPPDATEGSEVKVQIIRAPINERGRLKRAQGRLAQNSNAQSEPGVFETGKQVHRFQSGQWEDVWSSAWDNELSFPGGNLLLSVTPAMTVIDIDGELPPRELALAAVPALADALFRFDLGGSIGVDFPTLQAKSDRKAVDTALEAALSDWPHERTAMNGFGFVQLVARLEGPSLLHRMASSRVGAAARMALRRAELIDAPGALLLTVHPALKAKLKPEWLEELSRRTGREVQVETDPSLAIEAAFAQAISR